MSRRSDQMKSKAKKNLARARVKLSNFRARARVGLARHVRAFRLAAKRYRVALKDS